MIRNRRDAACLLALCLGWVLVAGNVRAADPPNPEGDWKFTLVFPELGFGEFKLECLLEMKRQGDKLTGQIGATSGEGIVPILDGTFKEGEVYFRVVDPQGIVSRYKGKVDGDKIKGKFECDVPDIEMITLDWNAVRQPAKK